MSSYCIIILENCSSSTKDELNKLKPAIALYNSNVENAVLRSDLETVETTNDDFTVRVL